MTEQTNADLIARANGVSTNDVVANPRRFRSMIGTLAAALEASGKRAEEAERERDLFKREQVRLAYRCDAAQDERNQYAAVVEKVRAAIDGPHPADSGLDSFTLAHLSGVLDGLASAPDDALRDVKADVWDEGWSAAGAWQIAASGTSYPWNPYRKEQS